MRGSYLLASLLVGLPFGLASACGGSEFTSSEGAGATSAQAGSGASAGGSDAAGGATSSQGGTTATGGTHHAGGSKQTEGAGGSQSQGQGGSLNEGQGGSPTQGQGGSPTQGQGGSPGPGAGGSPAGPGAGGGTQTGGAAGDTQAGGAAGTSGSTQTGGAAGDTSQGGSTSTGGATTGGSAGVSQGIGGGVSQGGAPQGGIGGGPTCTFDGCTAHTDSPADPMCNACVVAVCSTMSSCCGGSWDGACALKARQTTECGCTPLFCGAAVEAPSNTSCGENLGKCNPISDKGCSGSTPPQQCEIDDDTGQFQTFCQPIGLVGACHGCNPTSGKNCGLGLSCVLGVCLRMCCDATGCGGAGTTCDQSLLTVGDSALPGVCVGP